MSNALTFWLAKQLVDLGIFVAVVLFWVGAIALIFQVAGTRHRGKS